MINVNQHLNYLETVGLIRLAQTHPELEYIFRHALLQQVAYESLLIADRKQLHRVVAESYEHLYPDRLDELAATLAHHYDRAEIYENAVRYLIRAANHAKSIYANEEAIDFFRTALKQIRQHLHDNEEQIAAWRDTKIQLYEDLGDVLLLIGRHDEAKEAFNQALAQVSTDSPIWQARLYRKIGNSELAYENSLQAYTSAEAVFSQKPTELAPEWQQEWLQIQLDKIMRHYLANKLPELVEVVAQIELIIKNGTPFQQGKFFESLVLVGFRRERYAITAELVALSQASLDAFQKSGDQNAIISAHFGLGFSCLWYGDLVKAEKHLQTALKLTHQIGDTVLQSRSLTYLAILSRKRGQVNQVRDFSLQNLTLMSTIQWYGYQGVCKANLAWVAWREGDLEEAQELGLTAMQIWSENGYPFDWTALWPLVGVASVQNQISKAIEYGQILLESSQPPLPDAIATVVQKVITLWQEGSSDEARIYLNQAIELAQEEGYL